MSALTAPTTSAGSPPAAAPGPRLLDTEVSGCPAADAGVCPAEGGSTPRASGAVGPTIDSPVPGSRQPTVAAGDTIGTVDTIDPSSPRVAVPVRDADPAGAAPPAVEEPVDPDRPAGRFGVGGPWRRAVLNGAAIWVAAHLGYLAVMLLLSMINNVQPGLHQQWLTWKHWDTDWFVDITQSGYTGLAPGRIDPATAFFPLFPLLARAVNPIVPGGAFAAVIVVANLAFVAAVVLLHRLFEYESDARTALRGTWYLVIFPSGFFLAAGYNVSLAVALSVGCIYAIRRQHWWLAGLIGALASANRSSGVLLLIPFGYEYLRIRGFRLRRVRPDVLWAALVPVGLAGYMIYTWRTFGDPLRFAHAQANWHRTLAWPWVALDQSTEMVTHHLRDLNALQIHNLLDLLSVVFAAVLLALCFVGPWRLRRDQWALPLYGVATLVLVVIFPDLVSAHPLPLRSALRLVLEAFPAFLLLGRIGRAPGFDKVYTYLALVAQAVLLLVFLKGQWVA